VDAQPQVNGAGGVCKACAPVDFPFPPRFLEYLTECKARPGSETAGWRNCVVADHFCNGMIDGRIWLDVERGAMPVREVVYHQPPGTFYYGPSLPEAGLESVSGATEAHQFTDSKGISVWLPTKMKQSDTDGTYTEEVDIAHTRLNPAIDPRQFRVTFPPGAPVFNPATGYFLTTDPNDPSIDDTLPLAPPATHPDAPAN
jgi:hypothetical protein